MEVLVQKFIAIRGAISVLIQKSVEHLVDTIIKDWQLQFYTHCCPDLTFSSQQWGQNIVHTISLNMASIVTFILQLCQLKLHLNITNSQNKLFCTMMATNHISFPFIKCMRVAKCSSGLVCYICYICYICVRNIAILVFKMRLRFVFDSIWLMKCQK